MEVMVNIMDTVCIVVTEEVIVSNLIAIASLGFLYDWRHTHHTHTHTHTHGGTTWHLLCYSFRSLYDFESKKDRWEITLEEKRWKVTPFDE